MRHSNPNMVRPVIEGIVQGELYVPSPHGLKRLAEAYHALEVQTADLVPTGDRPFVVGAFLKAKALAHTQGFIAAYRAGTEF